MTIYLFNILKVTLSLITTILFLTQSPLAFSSNQMALLPDSDDDQIKHSKVQVISSSILNKSCTGMGSEGLMQLELDPNLVKINMSYCNFNSDSMSILSSKIKLCTQLEELDLSFNTIKSEGLIILLEELPHLKNLHTLILRNNNIDDKGGESLFEHLSCLRKVDLSENDITDKGTACLEFTLSKSQVSELNLKNNSLEDTSIDLLKKIIGQCHPILIKVKGHLGESPDSVLSNLTRM